MEEVVEEYFSSMSYLAQKIASECKTIKKRFGDAWCDLPAEKQEEIVDEHFYGPNLTNKYGPKLANTEISSDWLSLLRINAGEKIVVDFEHDENGWTWRDEHSGPFSWRTKSQQDLTLDDLTADNEVPLTKRKSVAKVPSAKNHSEIETTSNKNEFEEVFKKFGLKKAEKTACGVKKKNCVAPENSGFDDSYEKLKCESVSVISTEIPLRHLQNDKAKLLEAKHNKTKVGVATKHAKKNSSASSKKKSEGLQGISKDFGYEEISSSNASNISSKLGNCNKVFLESGENIVKSANDEFPTHASKIQNMPEKDSSIGANPTLKKTGFDFLDNW